MTDEQLLEAVARICRERGADPLSDPRWLQLAEGSLPDEDRAVLEAMAADGSVPDTAMDAFAPMSAEAKDRFAAAAVDAMGQRSTVAPVVNLMAVRRKRMAVAAWAFAAAAALFVVLRNPPVMVAEPLPEYELTFIGGDRQYRSDDVAAVVRQGSKFEILLRPATAVKHLPAAEAFLLRDGTRSPWPIAISGSDSGAFRIVGTIDRAFPTAGDVTIELVLTPGTGPPTTLTRLLTIE